MTTIDVCFHCGLTRHNGEEKTIGCGFDPNNKSQVINKGKHKYVRAFPVIGLGEWRPADSAPKGVPVLVTWLHTWPEKIEEYKGPHIEVCSWDYDEYEEGRKHWMYAYDGDSPNDPPSHWMPLPTRPTEEK